jgi:heme/copper-type cytochrome/quinol oxidase subunit 2
MKMEENGVYKSRSAFPQFAGRPKSAKARMLVSSILILLFAAAVFLGIIFVLCIFVIKCGFLVNGAY